MIHMIHNRECVQSFHENAISILHIDFKISYKREGSEEKKTCTCEIGGRKKNDRAERRRRRSVPKRKNKEASKTGDPNKKLRLKEPNQSHDASKIRFAAE